MKLKLLFYQTKVFKSVILIITYSPESLPNSMVSFRKKFLVKQAGTINDACKIKNNKIGKMNLDIKAKSLIPERITFIGISGK